jgi:hypothetical protein
VSPIRNDHAPVVISQNLPSTPDRARCNPSLQKIAPAPEFA